MANTSLHAIRKQKKQCLECGAPVLPEHVLCPRHNEEHRDAARARRQWHIRKQSTRKSPQTPEC